MADQASEGGELKAPKAVDELKQRYLARMGNISFFIKELKGQFAQWYNKRHGRYGVLWADRFKSVLVEEGGALCTMATYIKLLLLTLPNTSGRDGARTCSDSSNSGKCFDLNCVRANLADDPKDYRFCGYGAATGGCKVAGAGLMEVFAENGQQHWREFARAYRKVLFSEGEQRVAEPGKRVRRGISPQRVEEVLEGDGELTVGELVRCRVRYLTNSALPSANPSQTKASSGPTGSFSGAEGKTDLESLPVGTTGACGHSGICGENRLRFGNRCERGERKEEHKSGLAFAS